MECFATAAIYNCKKSLLKIVQAFSAKSLYIFSIFFSRKIYFHYFIYSVSPQRLQTALHNIRLSPVLVHHLFEYFAAGGRRIGNCVSPRFNRLKDAFIRRASRCYHRDFGILFPDHFDDCRRFGSARYIEDGGSGLQTLF